MIFDGLGLYEYYYWPSSKSSWGSSGEVRLKPIIRRLAEIKDPLMFPERVALIGIRYCQLEEGESKAPQKRRDAEFR